MSSRPKPGGPGSIGQGTGPRQTHECQVQQTSSLRHLHARLDGPGLEQDFNSLDAQYDASQAYIRSQVHAGWRMVPTKYKDGGFSGGNTDRPALQQLLADVRDGKIDVIVVYKVDRLTRSLADFAKLVELFDKHNVSFVSVTQHFNTTTSMGRLTLNVLLSFAQFEREVTSERIRDKIAASKRKGLWVGGMAPLGYDTEERKITVNKAEAGTVRMIYRSYLKLGGLNPLMTDLRKRGIVTKERHLRSGKVAGGIPFTRGPLAHLLRNPFYIGAVVFKGETLPGEQPAIIDRKLFDAVQAKLDWDVICGDKFSRHRDQFVFEHRQSAGGHGTDHQHDGDVLGRRQSEHVDSPVDANSQSQWRFSDHRRDSRQQRQPGRLSRRVPAQIQQWHAPVHPGCPRRQRRQHWCFHLQRPRRQ